MKKVYKLIIISLLTMCGMEKSANAQSWAAVGGGTDGWVASLASYNSELYLGGYFGIVYNTTGPSILTNFIAKWNGTNLDSVGRGMDNLVYALTTYNGELYAGGSFTSAGGNPASCIAKWNGSTWSPVGSGMNANGIVRSLAVYNGELYAGGGFNSAGGNPASRIAKWNGTSWDSVGTGMNDNVYSLAAYNGELYAGGAFSIAGGNFANQIAKWNGTSWSSVSGGTDADVFSLAVHSGELYAGGLFDYVGGFAVQAYSIAKWNIPNGIEENLIHDKINISPNPSNGIFSLTCSERISNIEIYDVMGKLIYNSKPQIPNPKLDLSDKTKGIYFIKVTNASKIYSQKIIIQ